jgi:hypothetical protein
MRAVDGVGRGRRVTEMHGDHVFRPMIAMGWPEGLTVDHNRSKTAHPFPLSPQLDRVDVYRCLSCSHA